MRPQSTIRHDVLDSDPLHQKVITNQPPMTLPEKAFSAHEGRPLSRTKFQQLINRRLELACFHVIGVVAEALVSQAEIVRFVFGLFLATTSQSLKPVIFDASLL